jgi:hypothetical protein
VAPPVLNIPPGPIHPQEVLVALNKPHKDQVDPCSEQGRTPRPRRCSERACGSRKHTRWAGTPVHCWRSNSPIYMRVALHHLFGNKLATHR